MNSVFPIVHERRVAGITLGKLAHRWAAMNPPSPDTPDASRGSDPFYAGSEPLDTALCDRFHFVLRVPDWRQLTKAQRRRLIAGDESPRVAAGWLPELVARTVDETARFRRACPERLVDYVAQFLAELDKAGLPQSPRRARLLYGAIAAVHAARTVLAGGACELEESAHLAVISALPQSATEIPPAAASVLAAHKQAWEISGLGADNAWRQVLEEPDPVERVLLGARIGVAECDLARLVTQALAAEADDAGRVGLATAMFLSFRGTHALTPAAWDPLARFAQRVLAPRTTSLGISQGPQLERWRQITCWGAEHKDSGLFDRLACRFVYAGFPDLWVNADWRASEQRFRRDLDRFGVDAAVIGEVP